MRSLVFPITLMMLAFLSVDCKKKSDPVSVVTPGLQSSSSSMTVLVGDNASFVVSGGTEPYSIGQITNPAAISASITQREVKVAGVTTGNAAVTVTDGSSPARSVTVNITVTTKISAGTAGSVSFTSNRGNFSVNGIAEFGTNPPVSGQGAIAMQDFSSLFILAYKMNSSTNMDLTLIGFESTTSNYSGTFSYPAAGKVVYISFYPGTNPTDSTFASAGYLLNAGATAEITNYTSSTMTGTFSGNGYRYENGGYNVNIPFAVTNGSFSVPIVHTGLIAERSLEKRALMLLRSVMGKKIPVGFRAVP